MKIHEFNAVMTAVNLALLIFLLAQMRPTVAQGVAPVLRGRSLEIVDVEGRPRATLHVEPAGKSNNGDSYPETVLLRLITERGRPSVKISTSEQNSGMSIAGVSGTQDTYITFGATGRTTLLRLKNEDGAEQLIEP